jgi:hypothetical protein
MYVWLVKRTDKVTVGQTVSVVVVAEYSAKAKELAAGAVGTEPDEVWSAASCVAIGEAIGEAREDSAAGIVLADTWTPPNYEPLTELADKIYNELPVTDVQALAEHAVAVLDEYTGTEQRCHRLW